MSRAILWMTGAVGLLFVAPTAPAVAAPAAGESIPAYDSRIVVAADGHIEVTETIRYDFGAAQRHGIMRRLPVTFRYDRTHDRVYPIENVTVTMDGAAATLGRWSEDGHLVLRIGDEDRTVTGVHTYGIRYTVRGAVNRFADNDELYWNAIGGEWSVPIAMGQAEVRVPAPIQRVACYSGPAGSTAGCERAAASGDTATFRQPGLGHGSGLTVVVALPPGTVAEPGPLLRERRDLETAFAATPATIGGAAGLGLAGVAAALMVAWLVGRDRRYAGLLPGLTPGYGETAAEHRRPLWGKPPVSVEFGPPDGVRPGQVGTLLDERADPVDVTATIVDFAVRRYLAIRELPRARTRDWELVKLADPGEEFLRYERSLFRALFRRGDTVRLSELRATFGDDLSAVRSQLYADMVQQGWYRQSPARTRRVARIAAAGFLVGSIVVTVVLARFTSAALVGLGLIAGALALLAVAGRFPARTGRGSAALARLQGFRLFIATAQADQIRFEERERIFSEFLPYAIVFRLAHRWVRVFAPLATAAVAAGVTGGAGIYWYHGDSDSFPASLDAFTTMTARGVAAPTASTAGTSGFSDGSGGGGHSGGGGGGGGGGSW